MEDETAPARKVLAAIINKLPKGRAELEREYGQVWTTIELRNEFEVKEYLAPYVVVVRKADRKEGTLLFQHDPRYYFKWGAYHA